MSKTKPLLFAVLLCCAVAAVAAAANPAYTLSGVYDYGKARQVVTYINRMRQNKGKPFLKMDSALTEAAMLRAAELAFRKEEESSYGKLPYEYAKRPCGEGNLKLIGEQRHATLPKVDFFYLRLTNNHFSDIKSVVNTMNNSPSGEAAFYSTSMHSIGCGSYISSQGSYYWVLYMMPDKGTGGAIPDGQYSVEVCIAIKKDEQTKTLSRSDSENDLTPACFEVTGHFDYRKAIEVVELTNKERAAEGLKPLVMDSTLMELAMIRAAEMKSIRKMTHTRPNGGSGVDIIDDFFYESGGGTMCSGENIACGQSTAREVVSQWMGSPGHRRNIMGAYYNRMGAGECDGYWVQLFVRTTKKSSVLPKSSGRIDEVTVVVTLVEGGESKVVKRKRGVKHNS